MRLGRSLIDTPLGPMRAIASDTALCALEFFVEGRMTRLDARLNRWFSLDQIVDEDNAVLGQTRSWLSAYFAGHGPDVEEPALDMRGASFERRVWEALRRIPPGLTTSY